MRRSMCLVVVVVVVVGVCLGAVWPNDVALLSPSVHYVSEPGSLGTFYVAPDMGVDEDQAFVTVHVSNLCGCRAACVTKSECMAAAAVKTDQGGVECRLLDMPPTALPPSDQANANYIFMHATLPLLAFSMSSDGLTYLVLKEEEEFSVAKDLCGSIPGHHLAIIKTEDQAKDLLNFYDSLGGRELWVDLRKERETGEAVWGDGTPFKATTAQTQIKIVANEKDALVFRLAKGKLQDASRTHHAYPLCQANILGGLW